MKNAKRKSIVTSLFPCLLVALTTLALLCGASSVPTFAQETPVLDTKPQETTAKKWEETASTRRVALVIGNGAYQYGPVLKNPVNDADAIAKMLLTLGFTENDIILVKDGDLKTMLKAVDTFGNKLTSDCIALVYYSGHGIALDGTNYLLPVDFRGQSRADAPFEAVAAGRILGRFEDSKSPINIVILDACRNNPFKSFKDASKGGLGKMDAPRGTLIAYATAPGSVADDNKAGANGLYTTELLKRLPTPGIRVEDMFKLVLEGVADASNEIQTPYVESSLRGNLYLVKQGPNGGDAPEKQIKDNGEKVNLKARMQVTTTPEDAIVQIDGVTQGKGAFALTLVDGKAKTVRLTVTAEGYEPDVRDVKLEPGVLKAVEVALEKTPPPVERFLLQSARREGEQWQEQTVVSLKSGSVPMKTTLTVRKTNSRVASEGLVCESDVERQEVDVNGSTKDVTKPYRDKIALNQRGLLLTYDCVSRDKGDVEIRARLHRIANPVFAGKPIAINENWSVRFSANTSAGLPSGKADYTLAEISDGQAKITFSYSDDSGVACQGYCLVERTTGTLRYSRASISGMEIGPMSFSFVEVKRL